MRKKIWLIYGNFQLYFIISFFLELFFITLPAPASVKSSILRLSMIVELTPKKMLSPNIQFPEITT